MLDTGFGYTSRHIRKPLIPQVAPIGIVSLDQRKLPFAFPLFDQFFTRDGWHNFIMSFPINEPRLEKVQDMAGAFSFTVLLNTPKYISGDADTRTATIAIPNDLNPAALCHAVLWHNHRQKE